MVRSMYSSVYKMLALLAILTLFLGAQGVKNVEDIEAEGYVAEVHSVTTTDGYILELHRIPYGKNARNNTGTRTVVFLMHGLLVSSKSFTFIGSDYSIAYNLADAGYDVWMGNHRGNTYSRRHVTLDPDNDKKQFFNFDYEVLALNDLPAMIDYVLATTKQEKLHYIGHAQGGTVFLVLNSMKTTYHSKFISAHLLAGNGYEKNFPNKNIKLLSTAADAIYGFCILDGYVEMKPSSKITLRFAETLVNSTVPSELLAGASVRQTVQFCQNFRDEKFRRWNYDSFTNLFKYGRPTPPSYDLSRINVDVTFHYSLADTTQSEADVLAMVEVMPNAKARKVAKDNFNHVDYIGNKDVKELVTVYIIRSLQKC